MPTSRWSPWSACPTTNGARPSPRSWCRARAHSPDAEELINLVKARKGSAHAPKQVEFVDGTADHRRRQGRQEGAEGRLLGRARADGGVAHLALTRGTNGGSRSMLSFTRTRWDMYASQQSVRTLSLQAHALPLPFLRGEGRGEGQTPDRCKSLTCTPTRIASDGAVRSPQAGRGCSERGRRTEKKLAKLS